MSCFLVTHRVTPEFTQQILLADEKKVIRTLPRELKWEMSWFMPEAQVVVAHWNAPTSQAIHIALERAGLCRILPILKIEPAVEIYPKRYVARRHAAQASKARTAKTRNESNHRRRVQRELSGAFAESITAALQTRSAPAHVNKG